MIAALPCATETDRRDLLSKFGEQIGKYIIEGFADSKAYARVQELEKEIVELKAKAALPGRRGTDVVGLGQFARQGNSRLLETDCPVSFQNKTVAAWVTKALSKLQAKGLAKAITDLKEVATSNLPDEVARLEALRLALIQYGMPVCSASKADKEILYKMVAAMHLYEKDKNEAGA